MRTRSQSRSLADPAPGSGAGDRGRLPGSKGMMTRARHRAQRLADLGPCVESDETQETRRRRRLANPLLGCFAESGRSGKRARQSLVPHRLRPCTDARLSSGARRSLASHPSGPATDTRLSGYSEVTEWRDWANLTTELVEDIAGRLLNLDLTEYLRFRAACKPWRNCTDDPRSRGGLDSRFRPRGWTALPYCASASRRRLLNLTTGARAEVNLPDLSTHDHFGSADGLIVLCHKDTKTVRLLNPLTGMLAEFPPITEVRAMEPPVCTDIHTLTAFYNSELDNRLVMDALKVHVPDPSAISGAGIDDSTSPPTLLLCLRKGLRRIVCAKPGDQHWVSVHNGEQRISSLTCHRKILFQSLLSFGGRCYVTTPEGDIMAVDLSPTTGPQCRTPRLVYIHRETSPARRSTRSFLVQSQGRMLMLRYLCYLPNGEYQPTEVFTSPCGLSRMELFEVDLAGRRLIPQSGIGDRAVFVGDTYTVMVSTEKFPNIAANVVYLNYYLQRMFHLGTYHFKDVRITPPRVLGPDGNGRFFPCACHWELDDYLICDVHQGLDLSYILNF